jgi:hypothetical protein
VTAAQTSIRGRRRAPILIIVFVALAAGIAAGHSTAPDHTSVVAQIDAVQSPNPRAISTAWYCPGVPDSFPAADQTITLSNVGATDSEAVITVHPDSGADAIVRTVSVPKHSLRTLSRATLTAVSVAGNQSTGNQSTGNQSKGAKAPKSLPPGAVVVEPFSPDVMVSAGVESDNALAVVPCGTEASTDWYFAAGTTVRGASQWLVLDDPFSSDARVDITLRTDSGLQQLPSLQGVDVPGRSRVVIPIQDSAVRQERVAVEVHAGVGRVVASQTLAFTSAAGQPGVATTLGALEPSSSWWFADGKAFPDAKQYVAVTDLGVIDAHVVVQALIGSKGIVQPAELTVASGQVSWVQIGGCARNAKDCLAVPKNTGYELAVQSGSVPVIAQTLSHFTDSDTALGATSVLGSTRPARRWVVARTRAVDPRSTSISVLNTGVSPAHVSVQVVHDGVADRPASLQNLTIAAGARAVLPSGLAGVTRPVDTAVVITSDRPIFAESTMYAQRDATRVPGIPTR